jgi:copper chaperone CopZ
MKSTYRIAGMSCDHCVAHIKQAIAAIPGVTGTTLTLDEAVLTVESDASVAFSDIEAAVHQAGDGDYTVTPA